MSEKTYKKQDKSILLRVLIVAFCLYLFLSVGSLVKELTRSRSDFATVNEEIAQTEAKVKELQHLTTNGTKEEIIEKAARERLGYVFADEQVYKDISGN